MAKFKATYHLDIPAKRLFDALVDFSDQRPEWWPFVAPEHYKVYSVSKNKADVREGSTKPINVWAQELYEYEWSNNKGKVRWTIQNSNIAHKGGYVEAEISPEKSGCKVMLDYNRQSKGLKGRLAGAMMQVAGPKFLGKGMQSTADILKKNYPGK